jgi:predicted cupin superfamily sugar epimerase
MNRWIEYLNLQPHPEGGWFKELYRSEEIIKKENLSKEFHGDRNISTAIYYLLESSDFSGFHRIKSDEIWHFYTGDALTIYMIDAQGNLSELLLGNNSWRDELPQHVVPKGSWFAAKVNSPGTFALVGCTVAPGFDFRDFEAGKKEDLKKQFPTHKKIIAKLCR